jgi:beta-lactamase regulating signal transducer with metallopeptidase domain
MTHVAEALSIALLHFVWQGIAGGVVWGILLLLLGKSSANSRYVASCIVLAALALAPAITFGLVWKSAEVPLQTSMTASDSLTPLAVPATPGPLRQTLLGGLETWVLPLWAAGVLVFTVRLAWAGGHASLLRRRGIKADAAIETMIAGLAERLGVRQKLRVLMSSVAEVPAVVGWIRPVILLPAAVVVGLTPQQLESLLAHELAHIRRYDYFVNILQMIVETFLFYHPAVWLVSERIRDERELCCDDLAVRSCGDALSYARALSQLEKLRPAAPSLAVGSANGPLFHRIQRLLGTGKYEHVPSRLACAAGLLTGFLCLGWFFTARAQQRETFPSLEELTPLEAVAPIPPILPLPLSPPAAQTAAPAPVALPAVRSPEPVAAPAPALPATPAAAVLPVPLVPAAPFSPTVLLPAMPQELLLSQDAHWVLFRGSSVVVHGSAGDEEEAKKASASFTGDLLWFRLDGKTFITQDKDVIDRIQTASSGFSRMASELSLAQRQLEQLGPKRRVLEASLHELQASFEQILKRSLRTSSEDAAAQQLDSEAVRVQMIELHSRSAQLEAMARQSEAELRALQSVIEAARRNAEVGALREVEVLRGAVREGKAQIVP